MATTPTDGSAGGASSDVLNGRYRLLEIVGEGGMAIVWRAEDMELHRTVAVKVLRSQFSSDPEFLERFRTEARSAAALNDPGVVSVYDVGQDESRHYLVMEYVPGRDLKALIREESPLPPGRAVEIAERVASAVAAAHAEGLVHRDIKPQNIVIAPDGRIKVADFGIARAIAAVGMTAPGVVMGTVHYLAPEVAGGQPATPMSDVYSIGVVLYEMLTRSVPFEADSSLGVAMKIMNDEPVPVDQANPAVPAVLAGIVQRAMAREPEERYRDGRALHEALERYREWSQQTTGEMQLGATGAAAGAGAARSSANAGPTAPGARSKGGPLLTWKGLGLAGVAILALAGLIPLWLALQARIGGGGEPASADGAGATGPAPTAYITAPAAPTEAPRYVEVPNFEGMVYEDAVPALEALGLGASYEPDQAPGVPVGRVFDQVPQAGAEVEEGTVVKLKVSQEGPIPIPQVTQDYATTEQILQSAGFVPQRIPEWSGDQAAAGTVLRLSPSPGNRLPAGSPVKVYVASGPWMPLGVTFEDGVFLEGANVYKSALVPGEALRIEPVWSVAGDAQPSRSYEARLLVTGPDGVGPVQGETRAPLSGDRPTEQWPIGESIPGAPLELALDGGTPPGSYGLWLGVYPVGQPDDPLALAGLQPVLTADALVRVIPLSVGPAGGPGE